MIGGLHYIYDKITGLNRPTLYPGEDVHKWELPDGIKSDYNRLNSVLESKYSREFLKICAFYNKMFPSLKSTEYVQNSYNVPPFTYTDQERSDTGTGVSMNYLKQIIDQVTSRLGTVQFTPYVSSEEQSLEYVLYRDEVERVLRMYITKDKFNKVSLEAFHDAAIVGYSHVFIDPWTGKLHKANDYEVGMFESQMNHRNVLQMLYRDYAFPVADVASYIIDCSDDVKADVLEKMNGRVTCDLSMYFNCLDKTVHLIIDGRVVDKKEYPFDRVLIATMSWDVGFSAVTSTSLFDLLYPLQREINKMNAKEQQLIRNYKGATPVFNSDVELAMKAITNGAGECLYIDSQRPIDSLMTVINPTPLDPELGAKVTEYKTAMYELAGIQNASFDMENMRSAAAVVALDQTRDSVFQAQLSGLSDFIADALCLYVKYNSSKEDNDDERNIDWKSIDNLLKKAYISLKPVHVNDPLSDEEATREKPVDYVQLAVLRCSLKVIKGEVAFDSLPYFVDKRAVTTMLAATLIKFEGLGIDVPDTVHEYLISAWVDDVANMQDEFVMDEDSFTPMPMSEEAPAEEQAPEQEEQ